MIESDIDDFLNALRAERREEQRGEAPRRKSRIDAPTRSHMNLHSPWRTAYTVLIAFCPRTRFLLKTWHPGTDFRSVNRSSSTPPLCEAFVATFAKRSCHWRPVSKSNRRPTNADVVENDQKKIRVFMMSMTNHEIASKNVPVEEVVTKFPLKSYRLHKIDKVRQLLIRGVDLSRH